MKKLDAILTTTSGKTHKVSVDEKEAFTPKNMTDNTVWCFIDSDGNAVIISGDKIESLVIKQ